jgi:predicted TIM-barrel fold metal-dependent hydrolase
VYCDFGDASRILDQDKRAAFVNRLVELTTNRTANPPSGYDPGNLCTRTTEVEHQKYELEDKIMYGSDWLVSVKDDRADYLCRFGEAFNATGLQAHRAKFFGQNARKAFNLP